MTDFGEIYSGKVGAARGTAAGANTLRGAPDPRGHFGIYGGRYVAETLMPLVLEVERAYEQ
ncbi:MAG: hypothetical protein ACXW3N_14270, partial [Rhodoplanes sp.]